MNRPAFPQLFKISTPDQGGMSLRDWFAGIALQGLLAGKHVVDSRIFVIQRTSKMAYEYADAMIALSEKSQPEEVP